MTPDQIKEEIEITRRGPTIEELFAAPILSPWLPSFEGGVLHLIGSGEATAPLLRYYPSVSAARCVGGWYCLGEFIGQPEQLELLGAAAEIQFRRMTRG